MDFSKRLKNLRNEKDISQEELARLLNVSRTSVTNYELGRNEASAQVLNKLSEIFNCSIDYLLGKTDIRYPQEIEIDDMQIAFASGIKGLNKENQETLKNIIDSLLAKQEIEEKKKKE